MDAKITALLKRSVELNAQMKQVIDELYVNRHEVVKVLNAANDEAAAGKEPSEDVMNLYTLSLIAERAGVDLQDE